jgi:hypothetical protein
MMKQLALLIMSAALLVGCQSMNLSGGKADEAKTRVVLDHHWQTFTGNDLDGVMADYTEDSVLITPDRTYKGLSEIRANFVSAFATYPKSATTMQLKESVVQRDIGYIIWNASAPKLHLSFGTDTFIVRGGKIVSQTYGGVASPM